MGQVVGTAPVGGLEEPSVPWTGRVARSLWAVLAPIGIASDDPPDLVIQKQSIKLHAFAIAPCGLAWGALYYAAGNPTSALVPVGYSVASILSMALFAWRKSYGVFLDTQLSLILLLPWILSMTLGNWYQADGVVLWSVVAPLSAALHDRSRSLRWYAGFLAVLVIYGATHTYFEPQYLVDENFRRWLLVINILGPATTAFIITSYLLAQLRQRRDELQDAHVAIQAKHEALVLSQQRILELERQTTERKMAGGFAHEMRNALSGSRLVILDILGEAIPQTTANHVRKLRDLVVAPHDGPSETDLQEATEATDEVLEAQDTLEEALAITLSSLERGLELTNQLLDYARIGQRSSAPEVCSLAEVVDEVVKRHEAGLRRLGITLNLSLTERCAPGDKHLWHSVVENFVLNARDAIGSAGVADGSIDVKATRKGQHLVLEVCDNGPGLPDDVRDRVFDPFFSTKGRDGTGLGLSVVRRAATVLGGEAWGSNRPEGGAVFALRAPAVPDDACKGDAAVAK